VGIKQKKKLRHTRVRDSQGFVIEPAFGLDSISVNNLVGCIFVPVLGLRSVGVSDPLGVNPVFRLGVFGIVDFSGRVDGRLKVLEKGTGFLALAVEKDFVGVVRAKIDTWSGERFYK